MKNNNEKIIKKSEYVLDIGGGHNPFHRANVIIEKYLKLNTERGAKIKSYDYQYIIESDAINLPLKNKSFDYIFSNHLIEHTLNPIKFIKELQRISSFGYLGAPSALYERMFTGLNFHKYLFFLKNQTIFFSKKSKKFVKESKFFGKVFSSLYNNSKSFRIFYRTNFNFFKINLNWRKKIKYKYVKNLDRFYSNKKNINKMLEIDNAYKPIKYHNFKKIKLEELINKMINPITKNNLIVKKNVLIDQKTNEEVFIINKNILIFKKNFRIKYNATLKSFY
jgi:ubiquinone/menaquinone biosynthesis C-methylase UbiE